MKKVILSSLLLASSIFANEIVIDKNSKTGQVILNSDKEYKEYLSKIYANKNLEDILYKHECDLNMLKEAVAKLILTIEKKGNIEKEVKTVSEDLIKMSEEHGKLKARVTDSESRKPTLEEFLVGQKAQKVEKKCRIEKRPVEYKNSDIKHSFINIIPDKEFKSQVKALQVYKIPSLKSEKIEKTLSFNENFLGDKYTKAGWVHIKDTGWVKGYEIYPKVMPESVNVKYETKEICE